MSNKNTRVVIERARDLEGALIAFFLREQEATLQEFFEARVIPPTARERYAFERALQRIWHKGIIESIGYIGRRMNYRISETVLARGLNHTKKRGLYADQCNSDGIESRRACEESPRLRG